jgi:hypothetical protein
VCCQVEVYAIPRPEDPYRGVVCVYVCVHVRARACVCVNECDQVQQ